MKAILLAVLMVFAPSLSFGQFSNPGLYNEFIVETSGYDFPVEVLATFDAKSFEFEREEKRLTIFLNTHATNNVAEIIIPANLIGGNLSFHLNDEPLIPSILHQYEDKSFIVLKFTGKGEYTLDITGTTYLPEFGTTLAVLAVALIGTAVFAKYGAGSLIWKAGP